MPSVSSSTAAGRAQGNPLVSHIPLDKPLADVLISPVTRQELSLNNPKGPNPPTEEEFKALLEATARSQALRHCPTSDLANAEALAARYGDEIRYVTGKGFLTYNGGRFRRDGEALRV